MPRGALQVLLRPRVPRVLARGRAGLERGRCRAGGARGAGRRPRRGRLMLGALAYAASSLRGSKQAGGLPSSFLLAVTPTKLHAFAFKTRTKGVTVKDEVAGWDRAGLHV